MREINETLKRYALKPHRYIKKGKVTMVDTDNGRFVIKEKDRNNSNIYQYLESRSFNYYPKIISEKDDDYEITEYIDEIEMPVEQKAADMIDLVSLLHNKTTHYKEVDEDEYKKIFEDITNNINYLYGYYDDIISIIEAKVYMSPSEYLFARNVSKIYAALNYCKIELDKWYELIKNKRKQRLVVLHNNLELDHFIRNKNSYLISWDKSRIDIPIFDLYKFFKRHSLDLDFYEILKSYEKNYPLQEEERRLLFILVSLPDKIEFNEREYKMCKNVGEMIDSLYKAEFLLSPYYSENTKENK